MCQNRWHVGREEEVLEVVVGRVRCEGGGGGWSWGWLCMHSCLLYRGTVEGLLQKDSGVVKGMDGFHSSVA